MSDVLEHRYSVLFEEGQQGAVFTRLYTLLQRSMITLIESSESGIPGEFQVTLSGGEALDPGRVYAECAVRVIQEDSSNKLGANFVYDEPFTDEEYRDVIAFSLDQKSKEYGYDSIASACSYSFSGIEKFRQEGVAFSRLRDAAWVSCFSAIAGGSTVSPAEVAGSLPRFEDVLAEVQALSGNP